MPRNSNKKPTRKNLLRLLDVAFQAQDSPEAAALIPQAMLFRDENHGWMFDKHVAGYGCPGIGVFAGAMRLELGVTIYVESDDDAEFIRKDKAPAQLRIPGIQYPVPVEVVSIGSLTPLMSTKRTRPLLPGLSISHAAMTAGTLGAFARSRDAADENTYLLSCNHVLTEYNLNRPGDPIVQPGKADRGKAPDDVVASLSHVVELIYHDREYRNRVDAALARIETSNCLPGDGAVMGSIPINRSVRNRGSVRMVGRTSGEAYGRVRDPAARLHMSYPRGRSSTSKVGFEDVVVCTAFSKKGDSGAIVYNDSNHAVGMIIAGSDRSSIFCKIGHICDELNIVLVSGASW